MVGWLLVRQVCVLFYHLETDVPKADAKPELESQLQEIGLCRPTVLSGGSLYVGGLVMAARQAEFPDTISVQLGTDKLTSDKCGDLESLIVDVDSAPQDAHALLEALKAGRYVGDIHVKSGSSFLFGCSDSCTGRAWMCMIVLHFTTNAT